MEEKDRLWQAISPSTTLSDRLRQLLLDIQGPWAYAILWRLQDLDSETSTDAAPRRIFWAAGYFSDDIGGCQSLLTPSNGYSVVRDNDDSDPGSGKDGNYAENDIESFYLTSPARSFIAGDQTSCPAIALKYGQPIWISRSNNLKDRCCQRCTEARIHGVRTLVFAPVASFAGLLEVGSTHVMLSSSKELADVLQLSTVSSRLLRTASGTNGGMEENDAAMLNHKQAERRRRETLSRCFSELQTVLPESSSIDRLSSLDGAVRYILGLRAKLKELEAQISILKGEVARSASSSSRQEKNRVLGGVNLEVRRVPGGGAAELLIRIWSQREWQSWRRVMEAARKLDLQVLHATMSSLADGTIHNVVVSAPEGLMEEGVLEAAFIAALEG